MSDPIWLTRAKEQNPEMSDAEVLCFCELKRRNFENIRIFNQKIRAFKKLVRLARRGNEYAAVALRYVGPR